MVMRPAMAGLRAVWASILVVLAFAAMAFAAELPALTGRVVDNAGIIDASTRATLETRLADFEKKSSDQVVVATIASLEGEILEDFANRLFRAWGLGQAQENNGVLLLVARDDRKVRIEVGYGLEGTLTDLHSRLIIENTIVPAFRAGDFPGGISRAVDDIILVLEGNGEELEARARRNAEAEPFPWEMALFVALWIAIALGAVAFAILPPMFGTRIGPGRYRWLGMEFNYHSSGGGSSGGSWSSGSGGGWSSGGGGFSGGGGSSGGGGASGGW